MKETRIDSLVKTVCDCLNINDYLFKDKLSLTLHYLCSKNPEYQEKMVFNYILEFAQYYYEYYIESNNLNKYSKELIDLSVQKDSNPKEMEEVLEKCTKAENNLKNFFNLPYHESIKDLFDESIEDAIKHKEEETKEEAVEEIIEVKEKEIKEEEEVKESDNSFTTNPGILNISEEFNKIDFSFIEKQQERLIREQQKAEIVEDIQLHQEILKSIEEDYIKNSNIIIELYKQYKEIDEYDK